MRLMYERSPPYISATQCEETGTGSFDMPAAVFAGSVDHDVEAAARAQMFTRSLN